jgi:uncharacterized membrane-anchored protein YitT (DUF2179 family)
MQALRSLSRERIALIVTGSLFASLSITLFIQPAGLLSGGLSGLALMLEYTLKVPTGLSVLLLNIPVFYLGLRRLQLGYMLRSLIGVVSFAVFLFAWGRLLDIQEPVIDDILLTALFGGAMNGIGYGLIFRGRGSVGGTDIIALILNRLYSFSLGSSGFVLNAVPLFIGLFLFDIKLIGYTLISMYVTSSLIDRVQAGLIRSKTVMIVSSRHEEISQAVIHRIRRGVTLLQGQGAFSRDDKRVILTTVSLTQLTKLKDIVAELDPTAFMTVSDASEVLGKGFGKVRDDDL